MLSRTPVLARQVGLTLRPILHAMAEYEGESQDEFRCSALEMFIKNPSGWVRVAAAIARELKGSD